MLNNAILSSFSTTMKKYGAPLRYRISFLITKRKTHRTILCDNVFTIVILVPEKGG